MSTIVTHSDKVNTLHTFFTGDNENHHILFVVGPDNTGKHQACRDALRDISPLSYDIIAVEEGFSQRVIYKSDNPEKTSKTVAFFSKLDKHWENLANALGGKIVEFTYDPMYQV